MEHTYIYFNESQKKEKRKKTSNKRILVFLKKSTGERSLVQEKETENYIDLLRSKSTVLIEQRYISLIGADNYSLKNIR